ncbi:MAG: GNAT family N-acetyltransferase [Ferruginibacter sp.]
MNNVLLEPSEQGQQVFVIKNGGKKLAEMVTKISGQVMTVYHTEVAPEEEGKGLAKELFNKMVAHAREQQLKILPLCVFVQNQLKKHPELYTDVWDRS